MRTCFESAPRELKPLLKFLLDRGIFVGILKQSTICSGRRPRHQRRPFRCLFVVASPAHSKDFHRRSTMSALLDLPDDLLLHILRHALRLAPSSVSGATAGATLRPHHLSNPTTLHLLSVCTRLSDLASTLLFDSVSELDLLSPREPSDHPSSFHVAPSLGFLCLPPTLSALHLSPSCNLVRAQCSVNHLTIWRCIPRGVTVRDSVSLSCPTPAALSVIPDVPDIALHRVFVGDLSLVHHLLSRRTLRRLVLSVDFGPGSLRGASDERLSVARAALASFTDALTSTLPLPECADLRLVSIAPTTWGGEQSRLITSLCIALESSCAQCATKVEVQTSPLEAELPVPGKHAREGYLTRRLDLARLVRAAASHDGDALISLAGGAIRLSDRRRLRTLHTSFDMQARHAAMRAALRTLGTSLQHLDVRVGVTSPFELGVVLRNMAYVARYLFRAPTHCVFSIPMAWVQYITNVPGWRALIAEWSNGLSALVLTPDDNGQVEMTQGLLDASSEFVCAVLEQCDSARGVFAHRARWVYREDKREEQAQTNGREEESWGEKDFKSCAQVAQELRAVRNESSREVDLESLIAQFDDGSTLKQ